MEYDKICLQYFLEHQTQLYDEPVAENLEEADEFLQDCMAVVCKNARELRAYLEDAGVDISGMSNEEVTEADEVFALPDGRFLVVEA
ncbi:MAG: glyoxalase [Roseburia sp.]